MYNNYLALVHAFVASAWASLMWHWPRAHLFGLVNFPAKATNYKLWLGGCVYQLVWDGLSSVPMHTEMLAYFR